MPEGKSSATKKPIKILIDTNVFHYIFLCFQYYAKNNTPKSNSSEDNLSQGLIKGEQTLKWLEKQSEAEIYYSEFTRLEMMQGLLRGKSILNMAKQQSLYRMRSNISDEEIQKNLKECDFKEIAESIENIEDKLEKITGDELAIEIGKSKCILPAIYACDGNDFPSIMDLCKVILSNIYITSVDCYIYASSVMLNAEFLITSDRYLAMTVNKIYANNKTGGIKNPEYGPVMKAIKAFMVKDEQMTQEDSDKFIFPQAFNPQAPKDPP